MTKVFLLAFSAAMFVTAPALAGCIVPAPIVGAGLPGLAFLGLTGGGYLVLKWRNRRRH